MEWLINIIKEWLQLYLKGMIVMWHGLLVDIPDGWVLCDGDNDTPDLRTKFIWGAADQGDMNTTGGTFIHNHDFTSNTHDHDIPLDVTADNVTEGNDLCGTSQGPPQTESVAVTGTTDAGVNIPPYYFLAFIMKT